MAAQPASNIPEATGSPAPASSIADDMLAVLDAFRYARLNLAAHVPGGPARVGRVLGKATLAKA